MRARFSPYFPIALVVLFWIATIGCSRTPNDAQISSDIQTKLKADSGLQDKQIGVQSENGTVTLSGTVDSDSEREAAARYAASAEGVRQVVNNLQVAPMPMPVQTARARETKPKPIPAAKHRHSRSHTRTVAEASSPDAYAASSVRQAAPTSASAPPAAGATPGATAAQETPAAAPAPPPPPQKVTIPSGTTLAVRLVDVIDSETAQQGQLFHATLNSPLAVEGDIAIPAGYDVEGHVVEVQSAGKFAGKSLLTLQLDRITVGGKSYNIQTDQYHREGSSRGKNTAEKVGAGAVIGAIIGGIAGGGQGAGIGAAAGAGVGGGVQAATKGKQIKLPTETVLTFTLQAPFTVLPAKGPNESREKLGQNQ